MGTLIFVLAVAIVSIPLALRMLFRIAFFTFVVYTLGVFIYDTFNMERPGAKRSTRRYPRF